MRVLGGQRVERLGGLAALALIALAMLLSACSDPVPEETTLEDAQQQESQAGPNDNDESAETADSAVAEEASETDTDVSEPSPPARASSDSEPGFEITADTVWRDVFDTLGADVQSCIREALDDGSLETALAVEISATDASEEWEPAFFSCIDPQVAQSLFASVMIAQIQSDEAVELSGDEQSCLHEWAAEIDVAELVASTAVDDSAGVADYVSGVVRCVPDLMVSVMLDETGIVIDELSEAEASCLRAWVVELDWAALVSASETDDSAAAGEFAAGMFACVPTLFVSTMLADSGTLLWDLSEAETSCLGDWAAEADWRLLMSAYESDDAAALGDFMPGLMRCLPLLFVSAMAAESGKALEDFSEEEIFCLQDWSAEADWSAFWVAFSAADPELLGEFLPGLLSCVPELFTPAPPTDVASDPDREDDHSDSFAEVTLVRVGAAVGGVLDYEGDLDILAYELEAGQLYQIDVELATLSDSVVTLYDSDRLQLASNDDHGGSTASRIYWTADKSEIYYVEVSGWGGNTGAYTLTVVALEIDDDHANSFEEATITTVGVDAAGTLDYEGDLDVFTIELEAGRLYQIDVLLGTLSDSIVTLYDGEGGWLASNDDRPGSLASRIYWEPLSSGRYLIEVSASSFGEDRTGSYTVAVIER